MSILNQLHTATNVGSGEAISTRGRTGATLKTHTVEYLCGIALRACLCPLRLDAAGVRLGSTTLAV